MRVLFISSGNSHNKVSSIVKNQGNSVAKLGHHLDFFLIKGKGISGYLKSIPKIRKKIRQGKYDIIHAHYALSAFAATLANAKPLAVSLMGSDIRISLVIRLFIKLMHNIKWDVTILKSNEMNNQVRLSKIRIIPNGIEMDTFNILNQNDCRNKLGWKNDRINILFPSDPKRYEKNYALMEQAMKLIKDNLKIHLHHLDNVSHNDMPYYYNAADLVVLTSLWEGSPNVIKEAMACNCPIVSTDVGDVKWVIGDTEGCYICSYDPTDVANKILLAIQFSKRTKGRNRILELQLDSETIAIKLVNLYTEVFEKTG